MDFENTSGGLTKKQLRQEKRELKQQGNQQRRSKEKMALRDLIEGDIDYIPEFRIANPSHLMNGLDYNQSMSHPKVNSVPKSQWINSPWRKANKFET